MLSVAFTSLDWITVVLCWVCLSLNFPILDLCLLPGVSFCFAATLASSPCPISILLAHLFFVSITAIFKPWLIARLYWLECFFAIMDHLLFSLPYLSLLTFLPVNLCILESQSDIFIHMLLFFSIDFLSLDTFFGHIHDLLDIFPWALQFSTFVSCVVYQFSLLLPLLLHSVQFLVSLLTFSSC